jgi:23S rRNA (uracil1939-C5)-methyltransferase
VSVTHPLPAGCEPTCHGCRHRSLDERASLAQKSSYLARALEPWADRIGPIEAPPSAQRLGYRDRVTLTARPSDAAGWRFGLVRRDELIAIHDCPVHSARVRALVRLLAQRLPPGEQLPLAYLHVCGAQATLIVKARSVATQPLADVLGNLPATGIEGCWLHLHPAAGRRLFARSGWQLLWGVPRSRDPQGLLHGPTAFAQAVPELHARSVASAREYLGPAPGDAVLDLYCGHGSSLREWIAAGAKTLGVELSGEAVELAASNAPGAAVLRGTCTARLPQIRSWWNQQPGRRLAYVNPPRSGLEPEVAYELATQLRPERVAYLSCSAGTLARDLEILESGGFGVERVVPYDFFPFTHHVEALVLLSRHR